MASCYTRGGLLVLLLAGGLPSCKKYLDLKPDQSLVIPSTVADCQALLDNNLVMNSSFPTTEWAADNYYLTVKSWNGLSQVNDHNGYIWAANADLSEYQWQGGYEVVLYANQALKTLNGIPSDSASLAGPVRGQALFWRAFSFYLMAQLWAQPYDAANASTSLGIPLRMTPDITEKSTRATVQETYDRIIGDLQQAVQLLPDVLPTTYITKTRPSRAGAYAALARVYLTMEDYAHAGVYADSCLQVYSSLMDYNQIPLDPYGYPSIPIYKEEMILDAQSYGSAALSSSRAKVDSFLYASYDSNDLRKVLFFSPNTGTGNVGTYQFVGSYEQNVSNVQFCGLATDEVYLTRAECYARAGSTAAAMADLNTLLGARWKTGTYVMRTALGADDALVQVLTERRKELLFRSLRWTDLRRLNKDPRFATTLTRVLGGTTYTLPPKDPRYTMLIPSEVIRRMPMAQNPR